MKNLSAVELIQGQLNAYNDRDLESFVKFYDQEIQVFDFGNPQPHIVGMAAFRNAYKKLFDQSPDLHSDIVNRIQLRDVVIDQEKVTGLRSRDLDVIVIYQIRDQKIVQVHFIKT